MGGTTTALVRDDQAVTVFTRRRARTGAGVAAALGAVTAMHLGAIAPWTATTILGGTWLLSAAVYGAMRWRYAAHHRRALRPARSTHRILQLAALHDLGVASIFWPLAGVCLLAPHSIHLVIDLAIFSMYAPMSLVPDFGSYMTLTAALLIPAYGTLVARSRRFARRLVRHPDRAAREPAGLQALFAATLAALIPGVLLLGIPSVLVAITGALFIPLSFGLAKRAFFAEQTILRALENDAGELSAEATYGSLKLVAVDHRRSIGSRLMALRMLVAHHDRDRVGEVLGALLACPDDEMVPSALETCAAIRYRPAVNTLVRLAKRRDTKVAREAVALLIASHGAAAEAELRALLGATTRDAQKAVLNGLGLFGTRASLEAIHARLERSDNPLPRPAAMAAIAQITARLPAAAPGQLSLTDSPAGELALAADGALGRPDGGA